VDGQPHILLEYIDGGSLRDKLELGKLGVCQSLDLAIQFCDGMIYANSVDIGEGKRGIVHRDVKPENIMLTKEGVLRITDFGLVKALGAPSAERSAGTPEYMSPEQFETMDMDTRSDIYSFGVVLYEMLTGRRPFPEMDDERLRFEHYKDCYQHAAPMQLSKFEPTIPKELEKAVLKCLEKNPEDRFENFEELRKNMMDVYTRHCETAREKGRKNELLEPDVLESAHECYLKGHSLAVLGKFTEAIECFDKATKIDPYYFPAWADKGAALINLNRYDEALTCIDRALNIALNTAPIHVDRYFGTGRRRACFYIHTWCYKGVALLRLNRFDQAIESFDKALEIDPKFELARKIRDSLRRP
jgi:serine/threonine protein kinase